MAQWTPMGARFRYGSYEQPVKQNVIQYKNQPGRIEHYTPGNSSVSEKEAKQVTIDYIRPRRQILTLPSQNKWAHFRTAN